MSDYNEAEVYMRNGLKVCIGMCHKASLMRGWWEDALDKEGKWVPYIKYIQGTKLALVHSEVSEALEGLRKDKMDEHLPDRSSIEVELADALIRIFDLAGQMNLDLGMAVVEKMRYNAVRTDHNKENRNAIGGKKI